MSVGKITAFAAILCSAVLAQSAFAQDPADAPPPPGAVAPPLEAGAPPPPGAGAPPPAIVGSNVNLRQGPGTSYTVVTLIPAGAPVNVGGCKGGWCQVSFQGQNGYIIATALAPPGGPGEPPPGAVAGGPMPAGPGYPPPSYIPPPPPYYYGYGPYYEPYYGPYGPYGRRGGYYRRW
jgi:Bacterial SH3 domain